MTAVGIDLGTTNSCVAIWRGGRTDVLPDAEGYPVTPSVVAVMPNGEQRVGQWARRVAPQIPDHTYRAVKRLMGRQFTDPQVALCQRTASFEIVAAENGEAWIQGRERLLSPQEIQGAILRKVKASADVALGKDVKSAVITVPAYFNDAQRKATLEAGEVAGLHVLRIINEPTAAALALELDRKADGPQRVAVYDLGGGTFDLSILSIDADGDIAVTVSNGDTFLGGDDFDRMLVDHIADAFMENNAGADLRVDKLSLARLRDACEGCKMELSAGESSEVSLDRIIVVGEERRPLSLHMTVTRTELEALVAPLIARTIALCKEALESAEISADQLDHVVLVGGQTRMPAVQQAVREFFGPRVALSAPDPDQLVARGAAVMAAALTGQLARELEDVTPFALGIELADGSMHDIIEANAKIPAHVTKAFSTLADDADAVTVRLRQGNSDVASERLPLGRFHLEGVRPTASGQRLVDVTADVDADGVVTFLARDRGSGRSQHQTVDTMGLSPRAIEKLRKTTAGSARQQAKEENADG